MKKPFILMTLALSIVGFAESASADTWVNSYFRSDGTYVNGHYRSDPDGDFYNNYSTYGNTNPYTGTSGYKRYDYTSDYTPSYDYSSDLNDDYSYDDYEYGYDEYSNNYDDYGYEDDSYGYDDEYEYTDYSDDYESNSFWSWFGF